MVAAGLALGRRFLLEFDRRRASVMQQLTHVQQPKRRRPDLELWQTEEMVVTQQAVDPVGVVRSPMPAPLPPPSLAPPHRTIVAATSASFPVTPIASSWLS